MEERLLPGIMRVIDDASGLKYYQFVYRRHYVTRGLSIDEH